MYGGVRSVFLQSLGGMALSALGMLEICRQSRHDVTRTEEVWANGLSDKCAKQKMLVTKIPKNNALLKSQRGQMVFSWKMKREGTREMASNEQRPKFGTGRINGNRGRDDDKAGHWTGGSVRTGGWYAVRSGIRV